MIKALRILSISLFVSLFALSTFAQMSDYDLLFIEMYNSDFPTEEGTISLVDGVAGDYQLLNYNVLGDLDDAEGRDAAVIMVRQSEEGRDYYLYVVLAEQSFPNPLAWDYLGRDIAILNLNIVEGQIRVEYGARGEGDSFEIVLKVLEVDGEELSLVYEGALDEGRPFVADEALSVEELSNITVTLDWFDFALHFEDGVASYLGMTMDGTATITYTMDTQNIAYGDLNGDGAEDAVVYFGWAVEGYEGESAIIAAVLNNHGIPQFVDTYVDRQGSAARLEELAINEDGSITFHYTDLVHQQMLEYSFRLEEGQLDFE